jgi:hypothetical protein
MKEQVIKQLFGTTKASGQPLYKSINPTIYVFPDKDVEYGLDKSNPIFAK